MTVIKKSICFVLLWSADMVNFIDFGISFKSQSSSQSLCYVSSCLPHKCAAQRRARGEYRFRQSWGPLLQPSSLWGAPTFLHTLGLFFWLLWPKTQGFCPSFSCWHRVFCFSVTEACSQSKTAGERKNEREDAPLLRPQGCLFLVPLGK